MMMMDVLMNQRRLRLELMNWQLQLNHQHNVNNMLMVRVAEEHRRVQQRRRRRTWWVKPWIGRRLELGQYSRLLEIIMNRLRKSGVYITIARTPDWSCASGLGRVYSVGDRVSIVTHRVSSGIFGSTSGANRPEIVADRVITRLFPINRLTIGLESRLHRVFSPKRGNIGSLRVSSLA